MAPEITLRNAYNTLVDSYSVGVIVFAMCVHLLSFYRRGCAVLPFALRHHLFPFRCPLIGTSDEYHLPQADRRQRLPVSRNFLPERVCSQTYNPVVHPRTCESQHRRWVRSNHLLCYYF